MEVTDERRRDLKTAGGIGLVKLESELLAKDIVYKADIGATNGLAGGVNPRLGKSTDATAFRRSLVINNAVLQERGNSSSQNMDKLAQSPDGEVITQAVVN